MPLEKDVVPLPAESPASTTATCRKVAPLFRRAAASAMAQPMTPAPTTSRSQVDGAEAGDDGGADADAVAENRTKKAARLTSQ